MRIWDLPCNKLCDKHLLGEHRELHCIWIFITTSKGGNYKKHPETLRWIGKLEALYRRHAEQVNEMYNRAWKHQSSLPQHSESFKHQTTLLHTLAQQKEILKNKPCSCKERI